MIDTTNITPERNPRLSEWELKSQVHAKLNGEVFNLNKAALFDALNPTGITEIIVSFDGYGGSVQIANVDAKVGDDEAKMPAASFEFGEAVWGEVDVKHSVVTIATAVENLAYDVLEQTHCGWQDGEGAYGDIVFDVTTRTITLDFNERYIATENYTHHF